MINTMHNLFIGRHAHYATSKTDENFEYFPFMISIYIEKCVGVALRRQMQMIVICGY